MKAPGRSARHMDDDAGHDQCHKASHHLAAHAGDAGGALCGTLVPIGDLSLIPSVRAEDIILVVLARPARRGDLH